MDRELYILIEDCTTLSPDIIIPCYRVYVDPEKKLAPELHQIVFTYAKDVDPTTSSFTVVGEDNKLFHAVPIIFPNNHMDENMVIILIRDTIKKRVNNGNIQTYGTDNIEYLRPHGTHTAETES